MSFQLRLLGAFLICCTCVQIATAQKNFEPGFIVTKNRDTISGFIDNRLWVSAPRSVEFKTAQKAPTTFYAPLDINGFFVGDSWYAAKIVAIDKSPHELGNLSNENKPQFDTDTLFLPALVVGRANLYTMEDENRKRHFFLEKDTVAITELIYRLYTVNDNGSAPAVKTNERYKGQLAYYLEDCPAAVALAKKARYEKTPMVKIFQWYNSCFGQIEGYTLQKRPVNQEFSVLFGASSFSMDLKSEQFPSLDGADFNTSVSASAGFGWNIPMRRTQGKWALYNTLTTRHYATKAHFVEVNQNGPFYTVDRTLTLALSHIMLSSAARYQIKGKKVTPFFYVGITAGLGFGGERNDHRITYFGSDATIEDRRLNELHRTFDLGPVFGAGLLYERFSLETRWTTGKGPASNVEVRSPTSTFYIWAGYRINS